MAGPHQLSRGATDVRGSPTLAHGLKRPIHSLLGVFVVPSHLLVGATQSTTNDALSPISSATRVDYLHILASYGTLPTLWIPIVNITSRCSVCDLDLYRRTSENFP
eukprot:scaffold35225_cov183-Amphora_coffeaeformis.AAC.4